MKGRKVKRQIKKGLQQQMVEKILLANPRGFCAGVQRAIQVVETALAKFGAPIYVRHEIVHNRFVVEGLREKGVVFVENVDCVPEGEIVIFSAHGVSKEVENKAACRNLRVFDATCPLVTKIHSQVIRNAQEGKDTILIGHPGHAEVEGTLGQFEGAVQYSARIHVVANKQDVAKLDLPNETKLAYVTQTTLSVDDAKDIISDLKDKYPEIVGPHSEDICYATQNRQDAVKEISEQADVIFVVGSKNSSNSNRLREIGGKQGVRAYLVDCADEIEDYMLEEAKVVGVTAGASAPEELVQQVLDKLSIDGAIIKQMDGVSENIVFSLPRQLID